MRCSYALGLLAVVASPAPALANVCVDACNKAKFDCQSKPNANMATCAAEYAGCIGYNPYADTGYVEPTACSEGASSHTSTATMAPEPSADTCLETCNAAKSKCQSNLDNNRSTCASEYAACLGYNPYGGSGYVEPTACSKGATSNATTTMATGTATMGPKSTGSDACLQDCNKTKSDCQVKLNANQVECGANFTACIGYSPYGASGYVEPTACSRGASTPTGSDVVVVTGAADRVKPAVALLALGAAALF